MSSALPEPAAHPQIAPDLALVCCTAGGLNLALEAVKVRSMQTGGAQTAPTLAALLQLPEPLSAPAQRLLSVVHPHGSRLIRVDEPVTLCRLPARDLHPLPPLLAGCLQLPCVRAFAWLDNPPDTRLLIILDLDAVS